MRHGYDYSYGYGYGHVYGHGRLRGIGRLADLSAAVSPWSRWRKSRPSRGSNYYCHSDSHDCCHDTSSR